ncbi:hypothetical protein IQ60_20015 [Streptomyces europaeiscabiei]|nr:hypothetical protein IQ60_20015 [Streptomyces europaeiscabiei]
MAAARRRSEATMASGFSEASSRAARRACPTPTSVSSMSVEPWKRRSRFHAVWPCRQRTILRPVPLLLPFSSGHLPCRR